MKFVLITSQAGLFWVSDFLYHRKNSCSGSPFVWNPIDGKLLTVNERSTLFEIGCDHFGLFWVSDFLYLRKNILMGCIMHQTLCSAANKQLVSTNESLVSYDTVRTGTDEIFTEKYNNHRV